MEIILIRTGEILTICTVILILHTALDLALVLVLVILIMAIATLIMATLITVMIIIHITVTAMAMEVIIHITVIPFTVEVITRHMVMKQLVMEEMSARAILPQTGTEIQVLQEEPEEIHIFLQAAAQVQEEHQQPEVELRLLLQTQGDLLHRVQTARVCSRAETQFSRRQLHVQQRTQTREVLRIVPFMET